MKDITKIVCLFLGLILSVPLAAKVYYIDPAGSDENPGTENEPFATIMKVQEVVVAGDIVYINPGIYVISADQAPMTTTNSGLYHCVFHMNKSGVANKPISYLANPNKEGRPIFDLSKVKPADKRITVFYITGSYLHFKGFDVVGTQVTITGHTQSECFRFVEGADNNVLEDLKLRDGMAIGVYLTGGSYNHILNCDAYNNYDSVSEGGSGENVDGFGCHISKQGKGVGNVFEGCRAWYNCDDGFDLINCFDAVEIINCWSFYNGYRPNSLISAGNGTGFKAGGYGMSKDAQPKLPTVIPHHVVRGCLAYYNKNRGFYANHHLGGVTFENNTVAESGSNFDMRNRKDGTTLPPEDVNGYGHIIKNNLSFAGARNSKTVEMINRVRCTLDNNSFDLTTTLTNADFISLDANELMKDRQADGSLPEINFLRLTSEAELRFWGMGCFASDDAGTIRFDWLKKPTIFIIGNIAHVVGPDADKFTKIYVNRDGEEQTDVHNKSVDLSAYTGILNLKATMEDPDGNVIGSITLKIKR